MQAAYNLKTILERHDANNKTICARSETVKFLENKNGWPGAAEEALSYANPTTSELNDRKLAKLHFCVI